LQCGSVAQEHFSEEKKSSAMTRETNRINGEESHVPSLQLHRYTPGVTTKHDHDSLHIEGWAGEKACHVTIARSDIAAGLSKRDPPVQNALQTASEKTPS
jgi:hypothetical protein